MQNPALLGSSFAQTSNVGNPLTMNGKIQKFVDLVLDVKPEQVTLVPDSDGQLTSDHGWNTYVHHDYLKNMISIFKKEHLHWQILIDRTFKSGCSMRSIFPFCHR